MQASAPPLTSRRGAMSPARALLHRALLRGLRPPRLHHAADWAVGRDGAAGLSPIRICGDRAQHLAAWLAVPAQASAERPAGVVVAVHGWGANASTLAPVVDPLVHAGFAVMLFDAASHGDSSSEDFSSLPRFAEDLDAALASLHAVPAVDTRRVALLGHSVGAAAVLLHAARQGGVRAVVSLSAFAHPQEVMERWLREHHIPRRWLGSAILEHVQHVIGERFDHIAPVLRARDIVCPVLLVHGAHDTTVPLSDARRLHAALPRAELLVVDGAHDLRAALQPHAADVVRFLTAHLAALAA